MNIDSFDGNYIPVVSENRVEYNGVYYCLVRLDKNQVLDTGISEKNIQYGVLAIQKMTIFHYGIPQPYLPYCLINEILCSDVRAGAGMCVDA